MIPLLTLEEARAAGVSIRSHNYRTGQVVRVHAGPRYGALHRIEAVDGDMLHVRCITVAGAAEFTVHYVDVEAA